MRGSFCFVRDVGICILWDIVHAEKMKPSIRLLSTLVMFLLDQQCF